MELQEAIEHAREVAERCESGNRDCAYQHDKLADWLEELKAVKDILGYEYDLDHLKDVLGALMSLSSECEALKKKLSDAERATAALMQIEPQERITTCFGHPIGRVMELIEADKRREIFIRPLNANPNSKFAEQIKEFYSEELINSMEKYRLSTEFDQFDVLREKIPVFLMQDEQSDLTQKQWEFLVSRFLKVR